MKLRIVSRVDVIGRKFYVERQVRLLWMKRWVNVGSLIGYPTEEEAKSFAEDYAKGDWVTGQATFEEK